MSIDGTDVRVDYSRVFTQAIDRLHAEGRYRVFIDILRNKGAFPNARCFAGHNGPKPITVWCSNDYPAMGQHPKVIAAMEEALHDVGAITYLYSFPPATPKDRVEIFRRAFRATLKDAEFLAEAKKGNFEIDPVSGEELQRIVTGLFKADPATVSRLSQLLQ